MILQENEIVSCHPMLDGGWLLKQQNSKLFVTWGDGTDSEPIDIPLTITALHEDGLTPVYQALLSLEDIDRLIEKLSAIRHSSR
jgi:hypothetical protein